MSKKKLLTLDDILDDKAYSKLRPEFRAEIMVHKKLRRVSVGPYATFYFESFESMQYQVQEMLRIEKGGVEQIKTELECYNALIPQGMELVATVMFEIDNPDIRSAFLNGLGGVEENMIMELGDDVITALPELDVDRTTSNGKASAVQFVHFQFNDVQVDKMKQSSLPVKLGINHSKYNHMTIVSEETRAALVKDFD